MLSLFTKSGATFDETKTFRYSLWRTFVADAVDPCLWVMLNPSTATEDTNDPTIRRCIAFSLAWGYDSCRVVNIFAFRSTDPKVLPTLADPVGPDNDRVISEEAKAARKIVCAWGSHGVLRQRSQQVRQLLAAYECWCFGLNQNGEPVHPLYQPADAPLVRCW